jgi:hypothetical protein
LPCNKIAVLVSILIYTGTATPLTGGVAERFPRTDGSK